MMLSSAMIPQLTINSPEELVPLADTIRRAAVATTADLATWSQRSIGIDLFQKLRFERFGRDPLDPKRRLNFVEQLNQTTSNLVAIKATEFLFEQHADCAPFILNLGARNGFDICSKDEKIVAEVFAAVTPDSNDKLKKDIKRVQASMAEHKYVIYFCPRNKKKIEKSDGVTIVSLAEL